MESFTTYNRVWEVLNDVHTQLETSGEAGLPQAESSMPLPDQFTGGVHVGCRLAGRALMEIAGKETRKAVQNMINGTDDTAYNNAVALYGCMQFASGSIHRASAKLKLSENWPSPTYTAACAFQLRRSVEVNRLEAKLGRDVEFREPSQLCSTHMSLKENIDDNVLGFLLSGPVALVAPGSPDPSALDQTMSKVCTVLVAILYQVRLLEKNVGLKAESRPLMESLKKKVDLWAHSLVF